MNQCHRFTPLPTVGELLKLYKLRALKQLSQNFLLDLKITNKIVRVAGNIEDGEVCEVGPGPGGITRSIAQRNPRKIILVEKDVRFKPMLESLVETVNCKCDTIYADILHFNMLDNFDSSLKKEWKEEPPNIHIIGNLPFSVSTYLITQWLKNISLKTDAWSLGRVRMTLTFQEEVGHRIIAPEKTKQRCRMSIMCQNWCKVYHAFTIPGKAFLPKPDVNVSVVHFEPLIEPVINLDFDLVERVLRVIFNAKGKYIHNSTEKLFPVERTGSLTQELLEIANLDETIRPTYLTIEEWRKFIFAYKTICDREPNLYSYDFRGSVKTRETSWKQDKSNEEAEDY